MCRYIESRKCKKWFATVIDVYSYHSFIESAVNFSAEILEFQYIFGQAATKNVSTKYICLLAIKEGIDWRNCYSTLFMYELKIFNIRNSACPKQLNKIVLLLYVNLFSIFIWIDHLLKNAFLYNGSTVDLLS